MKATLLPFVYSLLTTLLLPFTTLRLLWKSRKNPGYRKRLAERFAFALPKNIPKDTPLIWIHSVSVGEFLATLPLIQLLAAEKHHIFVTTTTPTGSAMVKQHLHDSVIHCYLPFDAPFLVKKFLNTMQPSVAVFIETEIWPNYLSQLKKNTIPALLINARLSEKSFGGYKKLGGFAENIISCFTEIACQNEDSQKRFEQLGAHTSMLGNIKFDLSQPIDLLPRQTQLKIYLGDKPLVLAASTHKGEDEIILNNFQASHYAKSHRLVIAPRHPERAAEILSVCEKHDSHAILYSQQKSPLESDCQTVIIDCLGELLYFYSLADFAIIGGSLIEHGGHNPLEAALFSTPCAIGQCHFNFESLIKKMAIQEAIIIVTNDNIFAERANLPAVGKNAYEFLAKNQGALNKYEKLIKDTVLAASTNVSASR